jgi:DNA polymerase-3 subunit epsilon
MGFKHIPVLVPAPMWGRNVRAVVSRQTWEELRAFFGARGSSVPYSRLELERDIQACSQCEYCSCRQDSYELHEVWSYDDDAKIQSLCGLVPICAECHLAMHVGYASEVGLWDVALSQLAKINNCNIKKAEKLAFDAIKLWRKRSLHSWSLDLSWIEKFVPKSHLHYKWLDRPRYGFNNRLQVIEYCRELINSDHLILDSETTGLLNSSKTEIIELAIINLKGKKLFEARFNPKSKVSKRVVEIHGITKEALRQEPRFSELSDTISKLLHGKTVIAYNAKFDAGILEQTCKIHHIQVPDCRWECAMWMYKIYSESGRFLKLPSAKHSALKDCHATRRLINKMAKNQ